MEASCVYLSQEAVHKHLFELTEAIHSVNALYVIRGIPRRVEDDDSVGGNEVDAERPGSGWDEKQPAAKMKRKWEEEKKNTAGSG